jgi:hypothetical protein
MNSFRWFSVKKDRLASALFAADDSPLVDSKSTTTPAIGKGEVALGFSEEYGRARNLPPAVIALNDGEIPETLSWLRVYSPRTSPLSQFARVITASDLEFYYRSQRAERVRESADTWSSVILGEMLAQGESERELSSIPLSRANACFSYAFARARIQYGDSAPALESVRRLHVLDADRRFVRRPVPVSALIAPWSAVRNPHFGEGSPVEIALLAPQFASRSLPERDSLESLPIHLNRYPGLFSHSIEERVISYNMIARACAESNVQQSSEALVAATLAAAAFLVGRSTSHVFLLQRGGRHLQSALVWFGVIAGIAGPKVWDPGWSRCVMVIERMLRGRVCLDDPHSADLCWPEFDWLSRTYEGAHVFLEMAKLFPRALAIEVAPGVQCQLRLVEPNYSPGESEQRSSSPPAPRDRAIHEAFNQIANLAESLKSVISATSLPRSGDPQQSLPLEAKPIPKSAEKKVNRRVKGKRARK